jgi:hypothetical protein
MNHTATDEPQEGPPLGLSLHDVLGAGMPKRDNVALWGNIVLLHLWGAVGYLKPGWLPAIAGVVQVVLLCAFWRAQRLRAELARRKAPNA